MSKIYLSVTKDETRMALTENEKLAEYVVERYTSAHLVGSVFKGVVTKVLRSIEAAFVDIGLERNAFLYLGEASLTEGSTVLIQITKDERGEKGPTAVRNITLPGKFVVLLLNADYIGLSRKINNPDERKRLEMLCRKLCPTGLGLVVRTAAQGISEDILQQDITSLLHQYQILCTRDKMSKAPALLHRELDLSVRILRDYLTPELTDIITDNETTYNNIRNLLTTLPVKIPKLQLYNGDNLFTGCNLQQEILSLSNRCVPLPDGGTLIIDYTEAMTVIDVNSGKFNGRNNLEETAMITNREAAIEIARQLRLRDIGGIVVVDFIDMHTDSQKLEIMSILQTALESDRMRPKVQDITVLNLVEITRKKSRQNLSGILFAPCPVCNGSGKIRNRETLLLELKGRLHRLCQCKGSSRNYLVEVHPYLEYVLKPRELKILEQELGCKLQIKFNKELHVETAQITDNSVDK